MRVDVHTFPSLQKMRSASTPKRWVAHRLGGVAAIASASWRGRPVQQSGRPVGKRDAPVADSRNAAASVRGFHKTAHLQPIEVASTLRGALQSRRQRIEARHGRSDETVVVNGPSCSLHERPSRAPTTAGPDSSGAPSCSFAASKAATQNRTRRDRRASENPAD